MNQQKQRTHTSVRAKRRRRNGRLVLMALTGWVITLVLWPIWGIGILALWIVLELIGV